MRTRAARQPSGARDHEGRGVFEKLIDRIGDLHEKATVKTVFGEPVEVNGRTIIPVARVRYGFGMGMGHGRRAEEGHDAGERARNGGGGGGISIRPLAVLEITGAQTRVTPIVDVTWLGLAAIGLAAWSVFWISRARKAAREKRP